MFVVSQIAQYLFNILQVEFGIAPTSTVASSVMAAVASESASVGGVVRRAFGSPTIAELAQQW